jgi:glutathione synthase/RimK-type ligase-like ATP-grasp enzyme
MEHHVLILLTLKKHQNGIWIQNLVQRLERCMPLSSKSSCNNHHTDGITYDVQVRTLEEWLEQGWIVSATSKQGPFPMMNPSDRIVGIVNRVSDSASPALYKACCAILGAATLLGIPVWNGPTSYALCGNKWCHHVIFQRAGLAAPVTVAYWTGGSENDRTTTNARNAIDVDASLFSNNAAAEVLIKPNAGGFGAGIEKIAINNNSSSSTSTTTQVFAVPSPSFEDGMALIQQYELPENRKFYRVWFLNGNVQCAVERTLDEAKEFTSGCVSGGMCSMPNLKNHSQSSSPRHPIVTAWQVPDDVKSEIEQQLLPLLTDAHCGSVEFLYTDAQNKEQNRLYFDLNLLSTLPIVSVVAEEDDEDSANFVVTNEHGVWSSDYDPWLELAMSIWKFCNLDATKVSTKITNKCQG